MGLDGFVVCRRLSAADDIVVMAFSFLRKFLLVVTNEDRSVSLTKSDVVPTRTLTLSLQYQEPWRWNMSVPDFEMRGAGRNKPHYDVYDGAQ